MLTIQVPVKFIHSPNNSQHLSLSHGVILFTRQNSVKGAITSAQFSMYRFIIPSRLLQDIFTPRIVSDIAIFVLKRDIKLQLTNFTRQRSFAEYWKYFVAHFNDVHAFGYNSAGSERIWMKFGVLRVHCLVLSLTNFGRDPRRSGSGSASRIFFVH